MDSIVYGYKAATTGSLIPKCRYTTTHCLIDMPRKDGILSYTPSKNLKTCMIGLSPFCEEFKVKKGLQNNFYCVSLNLAQKRLLLLLSSASSSSPLCRVFILIFLRQTMSLGNTVLQLFCCFYSWCLYR